MTKEYDYLSDKIVENQQKYLNNFITKINNNIINGIIEVKGKDKADENEKALTTDTHGDLMSIMGAAVMCGVKFKENEFLYYDRNEGIYYEKVDGKYYEYTPPYTGKKKQGKPIDKIAEDNSITVVPIPDTSNARDLYHLGDVLDRGQESLTSLLLCEVCPNIKLAQGNHEFDNGTNRNYGYEKEISSINLVLARMKHNGRIKTVYYDGKDNNIISYSHIPLAEDNVIGFFNFLNVAYMTDKYSSKEYLKKNLPIVKFLDEEFKKQEGHAGLSYKIKVFFNKKKDLIKNNKLDFETIKDNFTIEEMLIIKNVVSGALIERQFEVGEDGKITFINGGFNNIYSEFNELEKGEIVNSDRGRESTAICHSVIGHTPTKNKITIKGDNKCLDIDDLKSAGFEKSGENDGKSCSTVTNLNIKTGVANHSSFNVKREEKGKAIIDSEHRFLKMQRKNNNITDNFQKNKEGHDMQILNFKLSTEIITYNTDPINNIEECIDNIFNEHDLNFNSFNDFLNNLNNNEKLYCKTIKNIFDKAYKNEKFEIIENLLNNCIDNFFNFNILEEFIDIFNFICSDKYSDLSENFIQNIANKDDFVILKFFDFAIKYNSVNMVDKLLNNEELKNKLNGNIDIGELTFNALDDGNIDIAKVLIKHGFKFNTKKLTRKKEEFKTFENTLMTLAKEYNIKKENFKKINFSLVGKNAFKYKAIKEDEFDRLNNVLNLIKEQIEMENNSQIQKY